LKGKEKGRKVKENREIVKIFLGDKKTKGRKAGSVSLIRTIINKMQISLKY